MNLGEIRTAVRESATSLWGLNKMSEGKQFSLRDATIDAHINAAYKLFCHKSRFIKNDPFVLTVANQWEYDFPTNMAEVIGIYYNYGLQQVMLKQASHSKKAILEALTGSPTYYSDYYGFKKFRVYPAPQQDAQHLTVWATFYPDPLVLDTDTPIIPEEYHQALYDFALFRVHQLLGLIDQSKQSSVQQWPVFIKSFFDLAEDLREKIEFPGDDKYQFYTDDDAYNENDWYDLYVQNTNPTLDLIYLSGNTLAFRDIVTNSDILKVDPTGLYINGSLLAFIGIAGAGTFAGNGGAVATTITIADQGGPLNYRIFIQPKGNGTICGTVGEVTVNNISGTKFEVYNAGAATSDFNYIVIKS